jgi:DNA-binding CsgD family transcriptional regulator
VTCVGSPFPTPRGIACTKLGPPESELLLIEFPLPRPAVPPELTPAEAAVVELLLEDKKPVDIARLRSCSLNTVRNHIRNVHRKLGVANTAELIQICIARGRRS